MIVADSDAQHDPEIAPGKIVLNVACHHGPGGFKNRYRRREMTTSYPETVTCPGRVSRDLDAEWRYDGRELSGFASRDGRNEPAPHEGFLNGTQEVRDHPWLEDISQSTGLKTGLDEVGVLMNGKKNHSRFGV